VAGRCNASKDAQDAWDAGDASLASGRNADGSDAGSVFADELLKGLLKSSLIFIFAYIGYLPISCLIEMSVSHQNGGGI